MNGIKTFLKKLENRLFKRIIKSEIFRHYLDKRINEFIVNKPKYVGPKNRFKISDKAYSNNFFVNTNSGEIVIEDYVFFGKNVSLITGTHNYKVFNEDRVNDYPKFGRDIIIKKGAWIASNSIIIGPCTIGEGSVIAAGSVVIKDVNPFVIVAGNPAKQIKKIISYG